jgi:hypothetical protein
MAIRIAIFFRKTLIFCINLFPKEAKNFVAIRGRRETLSICTIAVITIPTPPSVYPPTVLTLKCYENSTAVLVFSNHLTRGNTANLMLFALI